MRIEDETDNGGRGWRQLTREDLHQLVSMALILQRPGARRAYMTGGDHIRSLGIRVIADAIVDRLVHYPAFGPSRAGPAHGPAHGPATRNAGSTGFDVNPAGPLPERPDGAEDALDRWAANLETHRNGRTRR